MRDLPNPYLLNSDEYFMHEALQAAHEGLGWTSPNPLVGCVLVRDGRAVGRAGHRHDGEEHAEVLALRQAGDSARGATCYVTLEPCSHVARQPSCCHALAQAGVARVVYGCEDADTRTAGRAKQVLPELGIQVQGGVLERECAEFLDCYLHAQRHERAFMHLKLALSADGKLACRSGDSQWLSGPQSLGFAHYLRQKYDAILVGWRTVLADNPRFTVREEVLSAYRALPEGTAPRHPVRVIVDPRLELLPRLHTLRLAQMGEGFRKHLPRLVLLYCEQPQSVTSVVMDAVSAELLPYIEFLSLPASLGEKQSLADIAQQLWRLGLRSVLVEGGARLAQEMLRQQAADKLSLVYTPTLIGADGLGFTPQWGYERLADCPRLRDARAESLGQDALLTGYPEWPQR